MMAVLDDEWQIIREAATRLREERKRQPLTRWKEVALLEEWGLLPEEMQEVLGMSPRVFLYHRATAHTYAKRERTPPDERTPWQKLGDCLAFFYEDEDRQNWVLWQMGLAERKR